MDVEIPELELVRVAQMISIGCEIAEACKPAYAHQPTRRRMNLDSRVTLASTSRFLATDFLQVGSPFNSFFTFYFPPAFFPQLIFSAWPGDTHTETVTPLSSAIQLHIFHCSLQIKHHAASSSRFLATDFLQVGPSSIENPPAFLHSIETLCFLPHDTYTQSSTTLIRNMAAHDSLL